MSKDTITVRCTAAFALGGAIVRPGETVQLSRSDAANLLHRGRVEVVDESAPATSEAAAGPSRKKPGRKPKPKPADAANDDVGESAADGDAGEVDDGEADDVAGDE